MSDVVAHRMRTARRYRGKTQPWVAGELTRLTRQTWSVPAVSAAEGGTAGGRPRLFIANEIVALARAFDLPITYFFTPPTDPAGRRHHRRRQCSGVTRRKTGRAYRRPEGRRSRNAIGRPDWRDSGVDAGRRRPAPPWRSGLAQSPWAILQVGAINVRHCPSRHPVASNRKRLAAERSDGAVARGDRIQPTPGRLG